MVLVVFFLVVGFIALAFARRVDVRNEFKEHMTTVLTKHPQSSAHAEALTWLRINVNTRSRWIIGDTIYRETSLLIDKIDSGESYPNRYL